MVRYILVVFITLIYTNSFSQGLSEEWRGFGLSAKSIVLDISESKNSIIYVGYYHITDDTVDFDPGPGQQLEINTSLPIYRITEFFILALDSNRNFQWVINSPGVGRDMATSVNHDSKGNIYVAGYYSDQIDLNPSGPSGLTTIYNDRGYFLLKLDSLGNYQWHRDFESLSKHRTPYSYDDHIIMEIDLNDDIYIAGVFDKAIDLDPGIGIQMVSPKDSIDAFLSKFNAMGKFKWAKVFESNDDIILDGMTSDHQGNIYVFGVNEDTTDFNPDPLLVNALPGSSSWVPVRGNSPPFICKLDSTGTFQWVQNFSFSSGSVKVYDVVAGPHGVYTTGVGTGAVNFNPSGGNDIINITNLGYLQKFNLNGTYLWTKVMGEKSEAIKQDSNRSYLAPHCMTQSISGDLFLGGAYENYVDFDPDSGLVFPSQWKPKLSGYSYRMFIILLDSNGLLKTLVEDTSSAKYTQIRDLELSKNGKNLYSVGDFHDIANKDYGGFWKHSLCDSISNSMVIVNNCDSTYQWIDSLIYTKNVTSRRFTKNSQGCDSIITLHLEFMNEFITDSLIECGPYRWLDGKDYYPPANITLKDTNRFGCDSIRHLVLESPIDLSLDTGNYAIWTNYSASSYQWISCDTNGYTLLTGETDSVLFPPKAGFYALVISTGSCTDTTDCYYSTPSGIMRYSDLGINIFPNPSTGYISIISPIKVNIIRVYNSRGKVVLAQKCSDSSSKINISNLTSGIYIIEVESNNHLIRKRLVRE